MLATLDTVLTGEPSQMPIQQSVMVLLLQVHPPIGCNNLLGCNTPITCVECLLILKAWGTTRMDESEIIAVAHTHTDFRSIVCTPLLLASRNAAMDPLHLRVLGALMWEKSPKPVTLALHVVGDFRSTWDVIHTGHRTPKALLHFIWDTCLN